MKGTTFLKVNMFRMKLHPSSAGFINFLFHICLQALRKLSIYNDLCSIELLKHQAPIKSMLFRKAMFLLVQVSSLFRATNLDITKLKKNTMITFLFLYDSKRKLRTNLFAAFLSSLS